MSTSSQTTTPESALREEASPRSPVFATTHWSVVLSAGASDTTDARAALARLCQTYWHALYAYVRRRGHSPHDAEDLTQEFFARLLAHNWVARAEQQKGRFRSFLLTALNRFLADEWDKALTQKRGGGRPAVSLDTEEAERRYQEDAGTGMTADRVYDRQWAVALLDRTMGRLRAEFAQASKAREFARLKGYLTADREDIPYAEAATATGLSEGAARVAVHRLRKRYRELFREEIAHTVAEPGEVEAELRYLIDVLAQR
jgi:RNA polymerase sigma-70 factor (ECF subfamily)